MMSRILQNDTLVTLLTVGSLQGDHSEIVQRYTPTGDLGRAIIGRNNGQTYTISLYIIIKVSTEALAQTDPSIYVRVCLL